MFHCSALTAGFEPEHCIYGGKMEGEAEKAERGGVRGGAVKNSLNCKYGIKPGASLCLN